MKLPHHNHRALKLFEFTSFFSSTKVSPQCFYFLQVFHSSKQQVGLSDLHGVPCTNLGRVLFLKAFFLLRPMACRFSGFGTSFGGRQTLRQHPERNPGVRAIWNTQTAVFRTCEAKRQVVWSHTDEILKIAYIPIYGPKTHSSFIFEAKSKACSKAIIMRAPLLCETCCNDQGVCHILQWAPSYLAMPKRCSTCMPFLGNRGFFRSAAQALSTPLSMGLLDLADEYEEAVPAPVHEDEGRAAHRSDRPIVAVVGTTVWRGWTAARAWQC